MDDKDAESIIFNIKPINSNWKEDKEYPIPPANIKFTIEEYNKWFDNLYYEKES